MRTAHLPTVCVLVTRCQWGDGYPGEVGILDTQPPGYLPPKISTIHLHLTYAPSQNAYALPFWDTYRNYCLRAVNIIIRVTMYFAVCRLPLLYLCASTIV